MNDKFANNAAISPYHSSVTTLPDNQTGEKIAMGVSVIPPEQVSPLLALPDELLVNIADWLPFADLNRLALTSKRLITVFNTEERLKNFLTSISNPGIALLSLLKKDAFRL